MTDALLAPRKYCLDAAQPEVNDDERVGHHQGRIALTDTKDVRFFVNVNVSETVKACPMLGLSWSELRS